jgi:hypothetical protein
MMQNIRQLLFQMLVLAEYKGDKETFITKLIKDSQKRLAPVYPTSGDYYNELQRATLKSVNTYLRKISPTLSPQQLRNLHLLAHSFSSL